MTAPGNDGSPRPAVVYVVVDDCCGSCGRVEGVFATRELADALVIEKQPHGHQWHVTDWEVQTSG